MRRQTGATMWKSRIGGAALTGLGWATGWAPVAVVIGLIVDPDGSMDEMWVAIGGYPGFLCGVVFFVLIQISKGRDRIGELSVTRVASVGAISGVLVIALPSVLVAGGDSGALSGPLPATVLFAMKHSDGRTQFGCGRGALRLPRHCDAWASGWCRPKAAPICGLGPDDGGWKDLRCCL